MRGLILVEPNFGEVIIIEKSVLWGGGGGESEWIGFKNWGGLEKKILGEEKIMKKRFFGGGGGVQMHELSLNNWVGLREIREKNIWLGSGTTPGGIAAPVRR